MKTEKMLPRIVYQMSVHGALIVGSYAKFLCGETEIVPGDFDMLVPVEHWQVVSLLIPETAKLNKFGGWRFETTAFGSDEIIEVDIWVGTLIEYLSKCKTKYGGSVCAVEFINNRAFRSEFIK
jgi:hypothetical protein